MVETLSHPLCPDAVCKEGCQSFAPVSIWPDGRRNLMVGVTGSCVMLVVSVCAVTEH